jgi:hypothetical protein
MSKVYYDTIPLIRLIERSSIIVAAKGVEPFQKTERKKIKKGDPYSWNVYTFRIISIIWKDSRQDSSYVKQDSTIYLSTFDESGFEDYKKYYEKGLSVVRRIDQYKSPTQPLDFAGESKTNGVLLFLTDQGDKAHHYRFTESNAYETINRASEVKELVGNTGKNGLGGVEKSSKW